jgi:hypothetical protein
MSLPLAISEGVSIIIAMAVVGLIFLSVVVLGELAHALAHRRAERRRARRTAY